MPRTVLTVCNEPGCPHLTPDTRCPTHTQKADRARGTAAERGYDRRHRTTFREGVLAASPYCVTRHPGCTIVATVADHWPTSRRDLEAQGLDPYDPQHGRGLCQRCHSIETAKHQPGGWHRRH